MEPTVRTVGVLDKSVALLDAVAAAPGGATLGELVAATGLPKATAHRLATALEGHALLRRHDDGRYRLGWHLAALARTAATSAPLVELARPILEDLRAETTESVQLYVRDGDQRRCVASLESSHELRTIVPEGVRLELGVGSAGRVLAGESGPDGWVASVEERAPGVASVSAAVVVNQVVVAAVGISGPLERLSTDPGPRYGPAVAQAAARISAAR